MKRVFLLFFVVILAAGAVAKNLNKAFLTNIHQDGKLYFVYESEMASCDGRGVKSLRYDYTHIDSYDKVDMLATCSTDMPTKVESLCIVLPSGERLEYKVESIYNEAKRKVWLNRFRCEIKRDVWFDLYDTEQPFIVELRMTDGRVMTYKDSERDWQKSRDKMLFIQELINLNKE